MIISFIRQNEKEDIFKIFDGGRVSYVKYPRSMHMTEAMVAGDESVPMKAKKDIKVKEVFTINAVNEAPNNFHEIEDSRTWHGYDTMDEAIKNAKELYTEEKKHYKHLDVSVCFNEFEYASGNIFGERECLSLKDLGVFKKRRK